MLVNVIKLKVVSQIQEPKDNLTPHWTITFCQFMLSQKD